MIEKITLMNTITEEIIDMDMVTSPGFIIDSVEIGAIVGKHNTYKFYGQIGETVSNTSIGTRDVSITGWAVAGSSQTVEELKNQLNHFVNPFEPVELYYSSFMLQFTPSNTIKYGTSYKDNNDKICKFNIYGVAYNPMFSQGSPSTEVFAGVSPYVSKTYNNNGDIPIGMVVTITASGDVVNPYIQNVTTGEKLTLQTSLGSSDEIYIDTRSGKKSLEEPGRLNLFKYKTLDSQWPQLRVGSNIVRFGATSGADNMSIKVQYWKNYWEVQE